MHPEQYSNSLSKGQVKQLHKSIHYVCGLACEVLADSSKFPETWLFKHRWGKGKKDAPKTLPNGERIEFLTVGGRTSAVIPSVQKKTGPVKAEVEGQDEDGKPKVSKDGKRKRKAEVQEEEEESPLPAKAKSASSKKVKAEKSGVNFEKSTTSKKEPQGKKNAKDKTEKVASEGTTGRRRSTRVSTAGK